MKTATLQFHYTVLTCDDRSELRAAIAAVLAEIPEFQVIGQAVDGTSCLEQLRRTTPDILILDIGMPGGGPRLANTARALQPDLYILIFSGINDPHIQREMLAAGADDYVVKTGRLRPLLEALNRALEKRRPTSRECQIPHPASPSSKRIKK